MCTVLCSVTNNIYLLRKYVQQLLAVSCFLYYPVFTSLSFCQSVYLFLDINYFHCLEIMRLLKLTEDNHKNIFGRYSSQRLKVKVEFLIFHATVLFMLVKFIILLSLFSNMVFQICKQLLNCLLVLVKLYHVFIVANYTQLLS